MSIFKTSFRSIIIVFFLFFVSITKTTAQENIYKKNAIYTTVGNAGLYFSSTYFYERILKERIWHKKLTTFVKVGYGAAGFWLGSNTYAFAQYGILTGVKKHHFEISAGPNFYLSGDELNIPVAATIGWRIQKPGGKFVFRAGIAAPEGIYTGIGLSF